MNSVALLGRLTKDAEVRYNNNGLAVARFTLAVNRRVKTEDTTADFISCIAFGKTAEVIEKYLAKGSKIALQGRLETGSYTNKDGIKVYTTTVVVSEIDFAESKSSDDKGLAKNKYQKNYNRR